ncbi:MAG: ribosome maturation factor RimP [Anaerovoracaceae bacterium]
MAKEKITDIIVQELEGFLEENQYELYNTEFLKEGKDWFLRVYIDKACGAETEYISTDDCEKVSRYLNERLDETDPIEQNYYLEVSSPGMDRALLKPAHYDRFTGKEVEVKLYKPIDGEKTIQGVLQGLIDGKIIVKTESKEWELPLEQVAKTKLTVVF